MAGAKQVFSVRLSKQTVAGIDAAVARFNQTSRVKVRRSAMIRLLIEDGAAALLGLRQPR